MLRLASYMRDAAVRKDSDVRGVNSSQNSIDYREDRLSAFESQISNASNTYSKTSNNSKSPMLSSKFNSPIPSRNKSFNIPGSGSGSGPGSSTPTPKKNKKIINSNSTITESLKRKISFGTSFGSSGDFDEKGDTFPSTSELILPMPIISNLTNKKIMDRNSIHCLMSPLPKKNISTWKNATLSLRQTEMNNKNEKTRKLRLEFNESINILICDEVMKDKNTKIKDLYLRKIKNSLVFYIRDTYNILINLDNISIKNNLNRNNMNLNSYSYETTLITVEHVYIHMNMQLIYIPSLLQSIEFMLSNMFKIHSIMMDDTTIIDEYNNNAKNIDRMNGNIITTTTTNNNNNTNHSEKNEHTSCMDDCNDLNLSNNYMDTEGKNNNNNNNNTQQIKNIQILLKSLLRYFDTCMHNKQLYAYPTPFNIIQYSDVMDRTHNTNSAPTTLITDSDSIPSIQSISGVGLQLLSTQMTNSCKSQYQYNYNYHTPQEGNSSRSRRRQRMPSLHCLEALHQETSRSHTNGHNSRNGSISYSNKSESNLYTSDMTDTLSDPCLSVKSNASISRFSSNTTGVPESGTDIEGLQRETNSAPVPKGDLQWLEHLIVIELQPQQETSPVRHVSSEFAPNLSPNTYFNMLDVASANAGMNHTDVNVHTHMCVEQAAKPVDDSSATDSRSNNGDVFQLCKPFHNTVAFNQTFNTVYNAYVKETPPLVIELSGLELLRLSTDSAMVTDTASTMPSQDPQMSPITTPLLSIDTSTDADEDEISTIITTTHNNTSSNTENTDSEITVPYISTIASNRNNIIDSVSSINTHRNTPPPLDIPLVVYSPCKSSPKDHNTSINTTNTTTNTTSCRTKDIGVRFVPKLKLPVLHTYSLFQRNHRKNSNSVHPLNISDIRDISSDGNDTNMMKIHSKDISSNTHAMATYQSNIDRDTNINTNVSATTEKPKLKLFKSKSKTNMINQPKQKHKHKSWYEKYLRRHHRSILQNTRHNTRNHAGMKNGVTGVKSNSNNNSGSGSNEPAIKMGFTGSSSNIIGSGSIKRRNSKIVESVNSMRLYPTKSNTNIHTNIDANTNSGKIHINGEKIIARGLVDRFFHWLKLKPNSNPDTNPDTNPNSSIL